MTTQAPAPPRAGGDSAYAALFGTDLSDRELQVLRLVALGRTDAQIGRQLAISPLTAKTHVRRVMAKLGAAGRANAVALGYHRGLLLAPKGLTREVIGRVLAEQRETIAAGLESVARDQYPPQVFRPDSELPDGIAGTAMRHAYETAARLIREGRLPGDDGDDTPGAGS